MNKVGILGTGGHALAIHDVLLSTLGSAVFAGFFQASGGENHPQDVRFRPLLGTDDQISDFPTLDLLIGVGQVKSAEARKALFLKLDSLGRKVPNLISRHASVSQSAVIDRGVQILPNSHIGAHCVLGENIIINSGAVLEHGTRVGSHTHISTGAIINGDVTIGSDVFIGSGAVIRNGISIRNGSFIKMGSVVTKDILD